MSNGSPSRLVNGENNIGAAATTAAASGGGGSGGGGGSSGVGGGGGGGNNGNNDGGYDGVGEGGGNSGNGGVAVIASAVGGVVGGVDFRDDVTSTTECRRTTTPVNFRDTLRGPTTTTSGGCGTATTVITRGGNTIGNSSDNNIGGDGVTECRQASAPLASSAETPGAGNATYDDNNMVAAMNEHLSTSSATSGVRNSTGTVSTTSTTTNAVASNNGCSRNEFQSVDEDGKPAAGILSFPCDFDHMYASMTDGGAPAAATATSALGVSPLRGNEPRQNDLTEVKHLKELLLLHLDLIQQQSEQIVTKDKLLAALRQENETLKLRLERMDRRVNLQKLRSESSENSITSEHVGTCSPSSVNSVNVPSTSELHRNVQSESGNSQYNESFKIRLNTSGGITTVKQESNDNQAKHEVKQETGNESRLEWEDKRKRRSDPTPLTGSNKRKRGVSCSSTVSNDTSSTIQDKPLSHDTGRKADRKGKSLMKKESFLTTEEHYYTAVGDPSYTLNLKEPTTTETNNSLEVPNWRVKIYTSCYTMEGTENLDDEIFNKRHLKLENDERRRKRWDVQRIREQRHIEKLKQRQERQNHQATCYNTNHTGPCPSPMEEEAVTSLWPDMDQIQSLQVDTQLPVTAFGAPIPSFTPSEFSLPWSNTTHSKSRRPKRSTGRRKSSRR